MSKKAEILALLKSSRPEYISGEEICREINVSRTAVWKHIKSLRQEGYEIDAVTHRGYHLLSVPDRLYPDEIKEGLDTGMVGSTVLFYEGVISTNREARSLALKGASEGTVVVAEEQTGGKGRMGRGWYSPRGTGVMCSLILRPDIEPGQAPPVTMLTAVAVASAVEKVTGLAPGIKWPNDLLLDGKKICGILTEMNAEMERINFLVVGTGINVNNDYFPEEIGDIATSLFLAGGKRVSRLDLLRQYLRDFEHYYTLWMASGFEPVLKEWKKRCVTLDRPVRISTPKESWEGWAVDVDSTGALVLRTDNGELKSFVAGEVSLRAR